MHHEAQASLDRQAARAFPLLLSCAEVGSFHTNGKPVVLPLCSFAQITTLLLNLTRGLPQLNLTSKARIPVRAWDGGHLVASEESTVVIIDGYHAQGALDKAQFGATAFGMVHVRRHCGRACNIG